MCRLHPIGETTNGFYAPSYKYGGFDSRRPPIFIEDAALNAAKSLKLNKNNRPMKGATQVQNMAGSILFIMKDKIQANKRRLGLWSPPRLRSLLKNTAGSPYQSPYAAYRSGRRGTPDANLRTPKGHLWCHQKYRYAPAVIPEIPAPMRFP